jgi:hypothetical protein
MRPNYDVLILRHIWFWSQAKLESEVKRLNTETPIRPYEYISHGDRHKHSGLIFILAISRNNHHSDEEWIFFKKAIRGEGEGFLPGGIKPDVRVKRKYNRRADLED